MTTYELNKTVIAKLPSNLSRSDIKTKLHELYLRDIDVKFYMLLCNDIHYYTVFFREPGPEVTDYFEDVVIECLKDNGEVKYIDWNETETALECWVINENNECNMFMLFPYDKGVI